MVEASVRDRNQRESIMENMERHINISLDIEGLGMEGTIGDLIFQECMELIDRRKITLKDLERYKLNASSYYDKESYGIAGIVETYIVDTLEELVRGDYE